MSAVSSDAEQASSASEDARKILADAAALAAAHLREAKRQRRIKLARISLIPFVQIMMPDPNDPDNPEHSMYIVKPFHSAMAAALEKVDKGTLRRLIITVPPRMGKSELSSRKLIPYLLGRDPYRNLIFGTYNQDFAQEQGKKIRATMLHPLYREIFPKTILAKGEQAADRLGTTMGGQVAFVGRGGTTTGRGADVFVVDDPYKDRAEADSPAIRKEVWDWWVDVVTTRLMSDLGSIILVMTRWHDDDLVGRLTDPQNPCYTTGEAEEWHVINLPALAEEDDVLGRKPGEALWPEKFSAAYLQQRRAANPRNFSALYQQRPSPVEGHYFLADMFQTYKSMDAAPVKDLRIYAASDHAVGVKQEHDRTCMLIAGLDRQHRLWLLDCVWKRMKPDDAVEQMLALATRWKPVSWFLEAGQIRRSLEPFLLKRSRETKRPILLSEVSTRGDKVQKAQSIIAHMSMGGVLFPSFAPWYEQAREELLKFDTARHDDFVDTLSLFGLKLNFQTSKGTPAASSESDYPPGSWGWFKNQSLLAKKSARQQQRDAA